jgi:hypothetical protein
LTDGAEQGDKSFYVVVASGAQRLFFIDLWNLESSDHVSVAQHVALIIQALSTYSIRVNCIVTDNAGNLVRTFNPDELTETVQILSGKKVLHLRRGCHSANVVLEDLGREEAVCLAFQNEMTLILQKLSRKPIKNHLRDEGVTSKNLVIQDVK